MRRFGLWSFVGAAALAGCSGNGEGSLRETPEGPTRSVEQADTVCPGDTVVHGIDVSYWQDTIDWSMVPSGGFRFAIARINHGDFMDPQFGPNWDGIRAAGMIRGAYQYFEPTLDPAWEAQVVIDAVGMLGPGDLPVTIDVEAADKVPPDQYADAIRTWLQLVEAGTGKKPMIYTGAWYWEPYVQTAEFADYPMWHAGYPDACQPPNPGPPDCGACPSISDQWTDWTFWQYSSSGSVPGISGNVDLDVFDGSEDALVAFANQGLHAGKVVSVDAPSTVEAGSSFDVTVTLQNVGAALWDQGTKLGTTEPRDRTSVFHDGSWPQDNRAAVVTTPTGPGEEAKVVITMRAPDLTGDYDESFGLVQEGVVWFADEGGPADDAITLSLRVVEPTGDGGGGAGGGTGGGAAASGATSGGDLDGSCDCRAAGASSPGAAPAGALAGLLLATALTARRRRPRSSRRGRPRSETAS